MAKFTKRAYGYKKNSYAAKSLAKTLTKGSEAPQELLLGSDQQTAFWRELLGGKENLVLSALAGTGKTTTLIQGLLRQEQMNKKPNGKTILLSFGKAIAMELQRKIPAWAEASTMHSLMYGVCRKNLRGRGKDWCTKWKLANLCDEFFPGPEEGSEGAETYWMVKNAAMKLIGLVKAHLTGIEIDWQEEGSVRKSVSRREPTVDELMELVVKFNVDLVNQPNEVFDLTVKLLNKSLEKGILGRNANAIDFDDMLYLPILFNWEVGCYEQIMVDESQDLNFNQQELLLRLARCSKELIAKSGMAGRIIVVGDPNQAIYGFRGADCESMDTMEKLLENTSRGVKVLPLTYTRRCPKLHVQRMKALVPNFEAMEEAPEGEEEYLGISEILTQAKPGQMMVCRMNAPLCLSAFRLLKAGVPVKIQGKDLGGELAALVLRLASSKVEKSKGRTVGKVDWKARRAAAEELLLTELNDRLQEYQNIEVEKLMRRKKDSSMQLEILEDKILCIKLLGEGLRKVKELVDRIEELFAEASDGDSPKEFVLLSSVHRAKGLEAEEIIILQPWLMPHPKAQQGWEQKQERCIQFVAGTRSKRLIIWETREL